MKQRSMEDRFLEFGLIDQLARADSRLHRLDPRAKLLTTLFFCALVVSFPRYSVLAILPLLLYPVLLSAMGELPLAYVARRTLPAVPFALMVGIFNPWIDTKPVASLGPLLISGGWLSFTSILLRCILTVSSAIILVASTGISQICLAFQRLGAPHLFSLQIMFLYRYLFVLTAEAVQMVRARNLRTFGRRGLGPGPFASLIASLLIRSLDRAQNIHRAMVARGFRGEIQPLRQSRWRRHDTFFVLLCILACSTIRLWNLPQAIGGWLLQLLP
jgi:cobalt/nickel transport system permease protein